MLVTRVNMGCSKPKRHLYLSIVIHMERHCYIYGFRTYILWGTWIKAMEHMVYLFILTFINFKFSIYPVRIFIKNLGVYIWCTTRRFETKRDSFNTKFTLFFCLCFWYKMRGVLSGLLTILHCRSRSGQRSRAQCCP